MAKKKREARQPYVLWGEGDTEQLFLELFKQYYHKELAEKRISVGNGGGGSPGSIFESLDKKVLSLGAPETPSLVLLDEDKGLDKDAKAVLRSIPIRTVNVRLLSLSRSRSAWRGCCWTCWMTYRLRGSIALRS